MDQEGEIAGMNADQTDFDSKVKTLTDDKDRQAFFADDMIPSHLLGDECFSLRELFQGVFSKLHPLFAIDCVTISLYNPSLSHLVKAYTCKIEQSQICCQPVIAQPVELSAIAKEIAGYDYPLLKSKIDWEEEFATNHEVFLQQSEYNFHGYIPIEHQGKILGTFAMHNHEKELSAEGLNFCCNIAEFLAGLLAIIPDKPRLVTPNQEKNLPSKLRVLETDQNPLEELEFEEFMVSSSAFDEEEQIEEKHCSSHPDIIGTSEEMKDVYKILNRITASETTVLILGETGTGKELIAKAIHDGSVRAGQPLIKVNCAAIPPNLIESELFGHEKGSFTGATDKRIGKFEQAHLGTIFLDEIGEIPLDLQVKLLRVLQEKEIERIGGKKTISTDVRIISATNRNLIKEVEAGRFRQDLFYRLNVFPLTLPPLRSRRTDIPLLAMFFLEKFAAKANRKLEGFSKKAIQTLTNHSWPGNVRELEHLIERHVVLNIGTTINQIEIPDQSQGAINPVSGPVKTIFENERDHIFSVLELCNGKISGKNGAASLLGVPATTLNSKIKRLGLAKKHVF